VIRERLPSVDWRVVRTAAAVALGLLAVVGGVVLGLAVVSRGAADGPGALGIVVVLVGLVAAVWKLWHNPDGESVEPAPWIERGALVAEPPESPSGDAAVAGTALTDAVERGARRARSERSVDAGLTAVRPMLRQALVAALVQGGADPATADAAIDEGAWTDDRAAAAVLAATVRPPERPLRRRVRDWLYPERAVRRRTARATAAVDEAATGALPPVVGGNAPRTMPVVDPGVDELRAVAEAEDRPEPRPAVDPSGASREDASTGSGADDASDDSATGHATDVPSGFPATEGTATDGGTD